MELSSIQQSIADFNKNNNLEISAASRMLDLQSEVGELCKEVLKGSDYGNTEAELTDEWQDELGDCFYSLVSLAAETGVDLEEAIEGAKKKYQQRVDDKGSPGSGS